MFIFAYAILITGSTYAYLSISASKNNVTAQAGCFDVNYQGEEITHTNLSATTNYLEGAKSTVTISKHNSCKIYNEAYIYIHVDDNITAPIETVQALRYKVMQGDNQISEGLITNKGDILLATVPITNTSTNYIIYIWVDSSLSNKQYDETKFTGYIYAESDQTSTIETSHQVTFNSGNMFYTNNRTENGLQINYDENTQILTLNGTSTSTDIFLNFYTYDNIVFNEGDIYKITKEYISGDATGTGSVSISGEVKNQNNQNLSTRDYADLSYIAKSNGSKTMTLRTISATEGKKLHLHLWFQNGANSYTFNNFKTKVTFTKEETKNVAYRKPYGSLPTPVRANHTFKGWNGKNLFNTEIATSSNATISNGVVTQTTADTKTDLQWKIQAYNDNTYIRQLTWYVKNTLGIVESTFNKDSTFNRIAFGLNGSQRDTMVYYYINDLTNGSNYHLSFNVTNTTQGSVSWNNIQLEEGSTATDYEPYYITKDTIVTQNKDHTLTAIWE